MYQKNTMVRWVFSGVTLILLVVPTHALYAQDFFDALKRRIVINQAPKVSQQKNDTQQNTQVSASPNASRSPDQRSNTVASFNLPNASNASPDILGIKLGISTLDDVRTILSKVTPRLSLTEYNQVLAGRSVEGRAFSKQIEVPNSKHVAQIEAVTQENKTAEGCNNYSRNNCEKIFVDFSSPPNKPVALSLTRELIFVKSGPSIEIVTRSLIEKYGEPGFQVVQGDRGTYHAMSWAWSAENKPIPLNAQHFCANQEAASRHTDVNRMQEVDKAALQAGCAAVMFASLQTENGIVKYMHISSMNHYATYVVLTKTNELVNAHLKRFEEQERENAAKTSAPQL